MRRVSFTATLKLSRRLPNERPHLTKRSFVRHAFSDLPQSRRVTVGVIRDKKICERGMRHTSASI